MLDDVQPFREILAKYLEAFYDRDICRVPADAVYSQLNSSKEAQMAGTRPHPQDEDQQK